MCPDRSGQVLVTLVPRIHPPTHGTNLGILLRGRKERIFCGTCTISAVAIVETGIVNITVTPRCTPRLVRVVRKLFVFTY
jgi:hypothetical protein